MKKRVLITGATGFVGRYLMPLLKSGEFEVFGTSYPERPPRKKDPRAPKVVYADLRSEKRVRELVKGTRPDWIFHLAAISNVGYSWKARRKTLETNLMATFFLFEAAREFAPRSRILYISSSDVYGAMNTKAMPLNEAKASFASNVSSPYAFTKVSGELLSGFYSHVEKLDVVVARPFPHTGPGQGPDFVCSDWAYQISRIEKGKARPVINVGNLCVKRDFCDVRDVVKAYVLLLKKGKRGEIYNVCSGKAVLLERVLEILLSYSSVEKIAVRKDPRRFRKADIPLLRGDNGRIAKKTGWKPEIPLKRTLRDLLEYWRQVS